MPRWVVCGAVHVSLRIEPITDESCRLEILEDAVAGPARWAIPRALRQLAIAPRNRESLYRLALIAEGRHRNAKVPGSNQAHNTPGIDGLEGHQDSGSGAPSPMDGSAAAQPTDGRPAAEPMAI
ncbi:MAG TPA: hypothetical protein VES03_00860 [Motilibacterales bacterium]|nr:hypothetical protein [Motilibacterales bacterium]